MPYLSLYEQQTPRNSSPLFGDIEFSKKILSVVDEAKKSKITIAASLKSVLKNFKTVQELLPSSTKQQNDNRTTSAKTLKTSKANNLEAEKSLLAKVPNMLDNIFEDDRPSDMNIIKKKRFIKEALLTTTARGVPHIIVVELPSEKELFKKSWLVNPNKPPQTSKEQYVERVPIEVDEKLLDMFRSRSLDFFEPLKEKYLSRWSRENTPIDSLDQYARTVRRSYTPAREVGDYRYVEDGRKSVTLSRIRTPLDVITVPYHTNYRYYQEQQPFRKYDIFQVRTWAYPIYKYLHGRDHQSTRPYSYTRIYGNSSLYTPPKMAAEPRSMTSRRSYSGYVYMAGEHSFDVISRPRSLDQYQFWRSHVTSSPWYWTYYGNSGLRHYNSFRPRAYTSRLSTYWSPYY